MSTQEHDTEPLDDDLKSVDAIVDQAHRLVGKVIMNEIPRVTCKEKEQRMEWKREKVRSELAVRLGGVWPKPGPTEIK